MNINSADCTKDLGVQINDKCSPSDQILTVTKKANGVLAQLRRTTISRSPDMVTRLYKTYVRPLMEASVQAWSPWMRRDVDLMEKVQRRATKLVAGIGSKTYEERLEILKLTTLEKRRERGDVLECFKMLNGFTDTKIADFFTFAKEQHSIDTPSACDGLLVPEKCNLVIRRQFLVFVSSRVVKPWNDLPVEIRTASSVNSLKNKYDLP